MNRLAKILYLFSLVLAMTGLAVHVCGLGGVRWLDAPGAFPVIACILFLTLGGLIGLFQKRNDYKTVNNSTGQTPEMDRRRAFAPRDQREGR